MQFITLLDYFLLPLYLVVIYTIAFKIRDVYYPIGHAWRSYFMPGLTVKILGAIGIGLLYQYYYVGGDTANYFWHAQLVNSAFDESIVKWFNLVFRIPEWWDGAYSNYISKMFWYEAPTEYAVVTITSLIAMFTFTTFLPTSILFAALAYTGIWAMFRTFAIRYPGYVKHVAIAVLFVPSTVMWGSGIFKDTICMFGVGWMTYGAFSILINRDFRPRVILLTAFSFFLIGQIKLYILLSFVPALMLWILFTYSHLVRNPFSRTLLKAGVIGAAVGSFLIFSQKFGESLGKYSLENVAKTSYATSSYIREISGDQGSAYDLGVIEPTTAGMLKKFPAAVNVTLFRPYIWETRKVIQLLNAFEAAIFLWVTIKILIVVRPRRIWRTIADDPTIQFCLIFTIIFAFAVGLSSGNFGTLSRYRIPCLPFFGVALIAIYYRNQPLHLNIMSLSLKRFPDVPPMMPVQEEAVEKEEETETVV